MRMQRISPSPEVADLVRCFTIVETDTEATRTLVPEPGAVLGIRYGGTASLVESGATTVLPNLTLTGMRTTVRRMRTSAGGRIIVVSFVEHGARAVFGLAMRDVFNQIIALDAVAPPEDVHRLSSEVAAAQDVSTRVRAIERFLLSRRSHREPDIAVVAALRVMRFVHGRISIRSIAAGVGLTQDRFEKRFRAVVGATPKQYCSILRFRRALNSSPVHSSLASVAAEAGYYDQSHFIREFRSVTGESPQAFLRTQQYC